MRFFTKTLIKTSTFFFSSLFSLLKWGLPLINACIDFILSIEKEGVCICCL